MIMHKALHTRNDVDRFYVSRKEVGRWIASMEDSFDASMLSFEDYIENHQHTLVGETVKGVKWYMITKGYIYIYIYKMNKQ